ncbi:hypothetical protein Tco_1104860 [Tanacetum coccineum]
MRGFSWSHGAERKDSFVKCDMMRNDNFVGVQVKAPISAMNVRVPEKDRWCGTRSKFMRDVIVDGGGWEDIEHDTSVECFVYYKTQGHVTTGFELQCHRGDQGVDAKRNDYCTVTDYPKSRSAQVEQPSQHLDDHANFGSIIWRHLWDLSKTLVLCAHRKLSLTYVQLAESAH